MENNTLEDLKENQKSEINSENERLNTLDNTEEFEIEEKSNTKCVLFANKKHILKQFLITVIVSSISSRVGFTSAFTSPAEESLREEMHMTPFEYSWIGSLMPLIALVGGLLGCGTMERRGRKFAIMFANILFFISWIFIMAANAPWMIYLGRAIVGISVGYASLILPIYLGEILQPEVRGMFGLLPTAFGNGGVLLCFIVGNYWNWRVLAYIGFVCSFPFLILTYFLPETPNWYLSKNHENKGFWATCSIIKTDDREYEAKKVLRNLRAEKNVNKEFENLKANAHQNDGEKSKISDLIKDENIYAVSVSLGLMLFQQLSGINAIMYYTTTIFKLADSSVNESHCTIIVGIVNFVSTFIATLAIDKLGRKIVLYISAVTMIITLGILSLYFYNKDIFYGWVPLACLVIYVLGFSFGFGPIPWLMMGEILPIKIKGIAASLSTSFNWLCTFIVTNTFPLLVEVFPIWITFFAFCLVCIISIVFIKFRVPETSGRSLEDIEKELSARRFMCGLFKKRKNTV